MSSISESRPTNHVEPVSPAAASGAQAPEGHAEDELRPDTPPVAPEAGAGAQAGAPGEAKPARPRGFAAIDRSLLSEIARKGGKAAHSAGTAHEFTSDEARVAGRKGGLASHAKRRKVEP